MKSGEIYTKSQIDKLGNTIIFLCNKIKPASKTQLLKLIFLIEQFSVKEFGVPFFDLKFQVWKLGPVSPDLFAELSGEPNLLSEYISIDSKDGYNWIVPNKDFSDDEFTDNEMKLLDLIVDKFSYCNAGELVYYTHKKGSPWYITAKNNGVLELLESGKMTTTSIEIKLEDTIADDEEKLSFYRNYKEFIYQSKSLKV